MLMQIPRHLAKPLRWLASSLGIVAILMLTISGPLYRVELLPLGSAFMLLRCAAYVGIAAMALAALIALWQRPDRHAQKTALAISFVAGLIAFYIPYNQSQTARSVPPIHDISTDLVDPPAFVAIAPLRAGAPNPVEYAGEETAVQQRAAYPDIQSMRFDTEAMTIFRAAERTVAKLGWDLVAADENEGRIEATATTRWFGFKDDVVIRIRSQGESTIVDMRSKSRLGRSDVGANAERIRRFAQRLERTLRD
jgi:uncharacterized protein (DUF1499 family)